MLNKFIIIFFFSINISIYCDEYVTKEELEPGGFGLYVNQDNIYAEYQTLNTSLWGLKVSPDGNYMAFWTHENFYIYNLKTKLYDTIHNGYNEYTWSPDSKYLLFTYLYVNFTADEMIYSVDNHKYQKFILNNDGISTNEMDSKGRLYYNINSKNTNDSSLYYLDFYKTLKSKQKEIVKINLKKADRFKISSPIPVYGNENYFVTNKNPHYVYTNECKEGSNKYNLDYCSFYKMDTNFNIFSESKIKFDDPDYFNIKIGEPGEMATYGNDMRITKNNEIFIYLNVRHTKEILKSKFIYWDSATIQARNMSGYYRMDTNCQSMKQLVRMWANVGGITATGDGETIYYGYMKPNKNCVIMKMNKYGKNKEVVIDLETFEAKTSVSDNPIAINNISYYPNPSKDYLNIKLDSEALVNEELEIYDLMGQNLQTQKIENIRTNINIQDLNIGIYYAKLKQNGTVFKFEVVR